MPKLLIIGLFIMSLLTLGACENTDESAIPLVVYDMSDDYMQDFTDKIMEEAASQYTIKRYDSKNSQIIQNEIIEKLIEQKPPLIIINPVDRLGARMIIQKAKQEEIPLLFINREPLKDDLDLYDQAYYIGADPIESAYLQARAIDDLFGGDPDNLNRYDLNDDNVIQLSILMGQQGHQDAELRTKHVISALESLGYTLDLLDIKVANFNRIEGRDATYDLIEDHGETMELIISNNDAMAVGAIAALTSEGYIEDTNDDGVITHAEEPWLPVIGIDGLPIATSLIESGHLYATVLNDSAKMAEALVEMIEIVETNEDFSEFSFTLEDDTYVWIPYQTFSLEIEETPEEESNTDLEISEED
jgi:methyl-galactoside transport system substrate-binding protein